MLEHGGGPFVPERQGSMLLKVFKLLAAEDLVLVTSQFSERLRPEIALTVSALFAQELGPTPPSGLRITGFTQSRRKIDRYVEVGEQGAHMVATAVRGVAQADAG